MRNCHLAESWIREVEKTFFCFVERVPAFLGAAASFLLLLVLVVVVVVVVVLAAALERALHAPTHSSEEGKNLKNFLLKYLEAKGIRSRLRWKDFHIDDDDNNSSSINDDDEG